jgi:AraC family transcriptional regulator
MHETESVPGPCAEPASPLLISLIEQAAFLFEGDNIGSRECLQRALLLLRARFPLEARVKVRESLAAWQLKKLMAHIDTNLSGAIRIRDLGDLINLSSSHLTRAFKSSVGISPYQYVIRRRVERAQELIKGTEHSLAQVALDCGLNDQSSLCRLFRRLVGQTPDRWRRENAAPCKTPQSLDDTMRRLPKSIASMEKAPGPKIPRAPVMRTAIAVSSGLSGVCVTTSIKPLAKHASGVNAPSAISNRSPSEQNVHHIDI